MTKPQSVYAAFHEAVARWPNNPFLHTLPETAGIYGIEAGEITYAQFKRLVDAGKVTDVVIGAEYVSGKLTTRDIEGILSAEQVQPFHRFQNGAPLLEIQQGRGASTKEDSPRLQVLMDKLHFPQQGQDVL